VKKPLAYEHDVLFVLTVPLPKRLRAGRYKKEPKKSRAKYAAHRTNAGPPPHLALAIAPARNQVLRDELIPCQANIESSLLLNISTSYIEENTENKMHETGER
jgi:hypothetical protein